jgi:hypothetical protein
LEIRLEDGFEHRLEAGLNHPVGHGGNTKLADLTARLRYRHPPHLDRLELARLQRIPNLAQNASTSTRDTIRATVARSTPGVRAPALEDTRSHACTKNAGS